MKRSLSAILVDDEVLARRHLRQVLEAHGGVTIVGEADELGEAARLAGNSPADVIFLDIDLPPHSGFDLLPFLDPEQRIVFVTAYAEHAVRAFEVNSLDYLLKPVYLERVRETIRRLMTERPPEGPATAAAPRLKADDEVVLRDRHSMKFTAVRSIAAIKAEGTYTRVYLAGDDSMVVLKPISEWEECLPSPPFLRLDRSLLINEGAVSDVRMVSRDEARMALRGVAEPFALGRAGSARLRKAMAGR